MLFQRKKLPSHVRQAYCLLYGHTPRKVGDWETRGCSQCGRLIFPQPTYKGKRIL